MAFVHPEFLWAMMALAVPLWLHLSRRRRYQEMSLGSLRFLQEVLRERRRRARFEEIPLMLLRLLAVVVLALAFGRPFESSTQSARERPDETLVLLDASGSVTEAMKREGLTLARQVASVAPEGSKVTFAQFSDDVEVITDVQQWSPRGGAPTDLSRAMTWALDRAGSSRAAKVVLIAHVASNDLPTTPPRVWPPSVALEVKVLNAPSATNAAVRGVSLLTPYVAEQMELEAEVLIPSDTDRTVTLRADGVTQTQTLPEGADRLIFKFKPARDEVRGTISVASGDAWPADDARPFAVRWVQPRRLLLVDASPGSTPFEGQAYFVDKALTASGAAHGKTPFQPEIVFGLSGRQGATDLSKVGAVALCGVPDLPMADARALAAYVEKGGGVIVMLDERLTRGAASVLETAGLLPAGLRPGNREGETRVIAEWDRAHPALASFDGKEGGDMRDIEWRDAFDLPVADGWKTLAKLDGGHALLIEKTGTKGRLLVLAHPLTREWADVPREPLFVPLVKSLLGYVSRAETAAPEIEPLYPGLHESRAPGLYAKADGVTEIVAAAASESLVAGATTADLRSAFGVPESPPRDAITDDPVLANASVPWREEIWPWLIVALLLLLMVENVLATRSNTVVLSKAEP